MTIRPLTEADLQAAADIHTASFEAGWNADAFRNHLALAHIALGHFDEGALSGFIVLGACTDQTDIITIAVNPAARGKGLGRGLVEAAETEAGARGAELIFLEVAEDNAAAIALYKSCGYVPIGKRKNYYRRAGGRVSALTMRKTLAA